MKKRTLTLGSLFDGSGGFPLGGVLAGIEPKWSSEIEPFPVLVTHKRLPQVKHYGDVSKLSGAELEPVDVVTWGSPCQDLSVAGKRAGLAGARSGLYVEAVRIVKEMLEATDREYPKFCVFENVYGLLSSNSGKDFITCLDMMQEIGFIPDVNVLDAQDMGVAQRRKRVYITWINVDFLLRRTPLSDSITLQLLIEILQLHLEGLSKASEKEPQELAVPERRRCEGGVQKRIRLFSLQKEDRLQKLLRNLEEIQAICLNEPTNLDLLAGEGLTEGCISTVMGIMSGGSNVENLSGNIGQLLKNYLEENSDPRKLSTISTQTRETMIQEISMCLETLLNMLVVTLRWMLFSQKDPMSLNFFEWVGYSLKRIKECTYAQQKHFKGDGAVGWNDMLRSYEQKFSAVESSVERYLAKFRGQEILSFPESLSWDSPEGCRPWQGTADNTEESSGSAGGKAAEECGRFCLNPQGSSSLSVTEEQTGTLVAQDHGNHPAVLQSAGFSTEHSAQSRSIGYEEEKSPTLRAGVVPAAMMFDNHPQDCRYDGPMEQSPTVTARYGTGGNNQPLVTEPEIRAFGVCSKKSHAMLSDNPHSGFYEAKTSRTLDQSGGNAVTSAQGGICVVAPDPTYALQGSMIGRSDKNGPQGDGINEGVSFTLNTIDRHAVATPVEEDATYCATTGSFMTVEKEKSHTLMARDYKDPQIINDTPNDEPIYIVRRLTPVECARLQGFPDWWCSELATPDPSDEEIAFWTEVWDTWQKIQGKKPKTEKQIRKWLADPYTDAAEYKLWGNGLCVNNSFFVLAGIAWAAGKDE